MAIFAAKRAFASSNTYSSRKFFRKCHVLAVFFFAGSADAVRMIPLALVAFGTIACLLGIIALLPDFDGFSDEHLTDERLGRGK